MRSLYLIGNVVPMFKGHAMLYNYMLYRGLFVLLAGFFYYLLIIYVVRNHSEGEYFAECLHVFIGLCC